MEYNENKRVQKFTVYKSTYGKTSQEESSFSDRDNIVAAIETEAYSSRDSPMGSGRDFSTYIERRELTTIPETSEVVNEGRSASTIKFVQKAWLVTLNPLNKRDH